MSAQVAQKPKPLLSAIVDRVTLENHLSGALVSRPPCFRMQRSSNRQSTGLIGLSVREGVKDMSRAAGTTITMIEHQQQQQGSSE